MLRWEEVIPGPTWETQQSFYRTQLRKQTCTRKFLEGHLVTSTECLQQCKLFGWVISFLCIYPKDIFPSFFFGGGGCAEQLAGILIPWPGIEPGPSAVKVPSPNHWTAREFPPKDICKCIGKDVYCSETGLHSSPVLLHTLLSMPRMQHPYHSLPRPFLTLALKTSDLEGWGNVSSRGRERACLLLTQQKAIP